LAGLDGYRHIVRAAMEEAGPRSAGDAAVWAA